MINFLEHYCLFDNFLVLIVESLYKLIVKKNIIPLTYFSIDYWKYSLNFKCLKKSNSWFLLFLFRVSILIVSEIEMFSNNNSVLIS